MIRTFSLPLLASAMFGTIHAAEPSATTAAGLIAKHQDALVEVQAVLKMKTEVVGLPEGAGGDIPEQEESVDAKGVVIHSSGLVAVPLAMLDPTALLGDEGMAIDTPIGSLKIKLQSSVSSIRIITADGREHPADVVFREPGAGLAIVKLTSPPDTGMASVTIEPELPAPLPFSQCFDLTRLGADFNRAAAVRRIRIVQETPAPFPLFEVTGPVQSPGSAVLDSSGRFLGMTMIPMRGQGHSLAAFAEIRPFILPASEIRRLSAKLLP